MDQSTDLSLVINSRWHDTTRRKLEAVRAATERDIPKLTSLLNTYLSYRGHKGVNTSDATRHYYAIALADWVSYCWPPDEANPRVPLLRAQRDDIEHYLAELQTAGGHLRGASGAALMPGSASAYLAGIRAFYRALEWADAVNESPARDVRPPRDPRPKHERRPAVPISVYKAILRYAMHDGSPENLRLHVIVRLMGDQGLRVSEVVNLRVAHLDMVGRTLFITDTKGGSSRTVPMSKATHQALERWLPERKRHVQMGEEAVLINVGKKVKKARQGRGMHANTIRLRLESMYKELGVPKRYWGAHTLRHTAGTRLYRNTRDLYSVAQILGHKDVNTSSIYAKMDVEGLRHAVDSLDDDLA